MLRTLTVQIIVVFFYMIIWFAIAQARKRNDVADIAWGIGFIVTAVTAMVLHNGTHVRGMLVTLLVVLWGIRLSLHISMRNRGKPEDPRYRRWREEWGKHAVIRSLLQVFLLQGILMVVVSLPVTFTIISKSHPFSVIDILGLILWSVGFAFESVGDYQLGQFKKDPANRGRIMTQGLWTYTRHPNYFGEVLLWWGVYLTALSTPDGWVTIVGPLTITFLILKVSGIPLLENKYSGNKEFESYKRRTSAFFPLPPRKEM